MATGLPKHVNELIAVLSSLPGIGQKSASRLAVYLLTDKTGTASRLAGALVEMASNTRSCEICYGYTSSDREICEICASAKRDHTRVCVVEKPMDMVAIEASGAYKGVYFILNGAISPIDGVTPEDLRIDELVRRVTRGSIEEVILATSAGLEGDTTGLFIQTQLSGLPGVRMTKLARGLAIGADIEFADSGTLARALADRS